MITDVEIVESVCAAGATVRMVMQDATKSDKPRPWVSREVKRMLKGTEK